ncbi:hypothetical protein F4560_001014 [Saccharothrix ecbatanensis]|uniref:JAB domain-containing protein n=1 Tax=Saccharothrix ecbatanensis TaxID=1105145 RepID=A0A7W9HFZ1_9PSEU|nr:Mov34/MPN/PAD-1 family protein [Saccharothrix ecbatanensis]MBB5801246.1 hypothetical protein [Saccharothrix ecbatanensis]
MRLADVRRFDVPAEVVAKTEDAVRGAGVDGYELFVLWTGVLSGEVFTIRTPHVPKQTSYRLESGLCVRVDGDELHRLNRWLYEAGEVLAVQVHTHPTEAYHSDTDNTYPIVTQVGGLSIVLPHFGAGGFTDPGVATYRLVPAGWQRLRDHAARRLVQVI